MAEAPATTVSEAIQAAAQELDKAEPAATETPTETAEGTTATEPQSEGGLSENDKRLFQGAGLKVEEVAHWTPEARTAWLKSVSNMERGYQTKYSSVAQLDKMQQELQADPVLSQKLSEVYSQHKAGLLTNQQATQATQTAVAQSQTAEDWDAYIAEAQTKDERDALIKAKRRFVGEVQKMMKPLQDEVQRFRSLTATSRQETVQKQLDAVSEKYGEPLVEKYRPSIVKLATEYPNLSATKLLQLVATEEEVESALSHAPATKTVTARKAAPLSVAPEVDDAKFKSPKGGWDIGAYARAVGAKLRS